MIVRKSLSWQRIAFFAGFPMLGVFALATVVTFFYELLHWKSISIGVNILSPISTALALFLGFRTNSAYDRWWEARTLWGGIVNHSRNLARQVLTLTDAPKSDAEERTLKAFEKEMVYSQIAFVHALRCFLRQQPASDDIAPYLAPALVESLRDQKNIPQAILLHMSERLRQAFRDGYFDSIRFTAISNTLSELTNAQGGCERIKNTPIPRQYDFFPRLYVGIYCILLPFGLVSEMHWYTPMAAVAIGFLFFVLDSIGRNIESPFENTINDTPMSAISRTIEINLRQMLGEKDLPSPVEPVDGFLY